MPFVPMSWLRDHVAVPEDTTAEQLAATLVRVGLEEEQILPPVVTGPLVVGRVLNAVKEEHSNGKTINYCRVDVGEHNDAPGEGSESAEVASRGIVCGAHNFGPGDHVVVALPGTVLPGPFPIAARKTYGHISDGMICSAKELGLGEDHDGILVLEQYLGSEAVPGPGTSALDLLGLGEEVLEINVTPDRGYCFSMRGVAREYSHATGQAFTDPGVEENLSLRLPSATEDAFAVEVHDSVPASSGLTSPGCDRFVTRIVRGIDPTASSPAWLRARLVQAGMRPISLAVDVTNYVMLDLGQPLHAYDLGALTAPIVVRRAQAGEKLTTIDDVERALHPEDLLITDSRGGHAARPLGLAGVMGGAETEVSRSTTDVLIESAHFAPVSIARSARRHKLPSEAAKRFERGVDPRLQAVAAQRVVDLLVAHGGGTADPAVGDLGHSAEALPAPILFDPAEVVRLTGVAHSREDALAVLETIGCTVAEAPQASTDDATAAVSVTPPSWRPDLTGPAHLVEEVARITGYDAIASILPKAPGGRGLTPEQRGRRDVARALAESGYVEVLSYPFIGDVHDRMLIPSADPRRITLRLANPFAEDAPALRTSLLDTLLPTARLNVARGSGRPGSSDLALFEMGLVTHPAGIQAAPSPGTDQRPSAGELEALARAVPAQPWHIAGVLTGRRLPDGVAELPQTGRTADWADAIEAAQTVAATLGLELELRRPEGGHAPWHPGRCAELRVAGHEGIVGHAGELHPQVVARLELPARSCAFDMDLSALLGAMATTPPPARAVSSFPPAKEDVALVVDESVPAAEVFAAVREGAGELAEEIGLFDVYTGAQLAAGKKSLAFSLRLRASDRTLTAEETAAVRERVVASAAERVGAVLRG
ncbi:phenylalanine--tRNA ligase subunit beta [Bogoriella caseilytica]|uniref:Phenylalanine--tRNA ligase beta subunit n=1 Tax=Bogoriella caseilytica TaxID=56055 RepID=A0A3N2BG19_9MICO|nr:phenylalanine--tRNA ligase subunit beta [Bogoriella caseilytica]ROR74206.1 phenylalanyl-tRNA synthetase beta subunit [Bogoriella caseilytica]